MSLEPISNPIWVWFDLDSRHYISRIYFALLKLKFSIVGLIIHRVHFFVNSTFILMVILSKLSMTCLVLSQNFLLLTIYGYKDKESNIEAFFILFSLISIKKCFYVRMKLVGESWRSTTINTINIGFSCNIFFTLIMVRTFQIIHETLVCFNLSPKLNKSMSPSPRQTKEYVQELVVE